MRYLLLLLLPFFALNSIDLESFYRIKGNTLITAEGLRYPAIHFESALHEELAYRLKDPKQASIISHAYQKHIASIVPEELIIPFSNALLKVCYFFGSQERSPEKGLWIALKAEGCASWAEQKRQAITDFVTEANRSYLMPKGERTGPFTIAILTTSASGGNESVARGIVGFLSQVENIQTVVVDVETLAKKADPIMLATGKVTYDGLYASIFQQQEDFEILVQRDVVTKQLSQYIPSCLGSMLKKTIREINPDLIISTRNYTTDDLALATLDIPFRLWHCDHELSFFLLDVYGKNDPDAIRFWLPSLAPAVFRPLFIKSDRLDLYNDLDDEQVLMEKVAFLLNITPKEAKEQFECLGFPTRPEFKEITAPEAIENLKKKWNVRGDETPILVSMGKNGVGTLEKVFDQLIAIPSHHWKFFFVCGRNEELKKKLESKLPVNCANLFTITGFLSPEEMNELMNLAPVTITKPGGAVTSEATVTQNYLLMMGSHPWEEANRAQIERIGLGQEYGEGQPLEVQIEQSLAKAKYIRSSQPAIMPDWKKLLMRELKSINQ